MPTTLKGGMTFTQGSGVADAGFGKLTGPLLAYIESYAEGWEKNSIIAKLFKMTKTTHYAENITGLTSMGNFKPTAELEPSGVTGMRETPVKQIPAISWTNSFDISKEMIADHLILDLENAPKAFMQSRGRTREMFGAALYGAALNQASTTTYEKQAFDVTTADGLPLFSNEHHSVFDDGPVQSNCMSDELNADTFAYAETEMQNFMDERGNPLNLQPDTLLIPNVARLKHAAWATVGSGNMPGTNDNDFNYLAGRYNVLSWNFLNRYIDTTAATLPWVLLDSQAIQDYLAAVWTDRQPLNLYSEYVPNLRKNVWYGDERFNAAFVNWRFAYAGGIASADPMP